MRFHAVLALFDGLKHLNGGLLKKGTECFESLSMNGILSIILTLFPFVLSPSKDSERVFQQPAGPLRQAQISVCRFNEMLMK